MNLSHSCILTLTPRGFKQKMGKRQKT
jgi:hypothetical protein